MIPAPAPTEPRLQGDVVLVLDDDRLVRMILSDQVQAIGGVPVAAANLAEAKALAGQHTFAAAVIDKNLGPEDGLDFLRWLRVEHPRCEALILTGYGNTQSAIEALRLGASDYLVKPSEVEMVSHRLVLLCERRRMVEERDNLQAQLIQADRLAALGTLAAGVVHEINNPLTYVLFNLDYLEQQLGLVRQRAAGLATGPDPELDAALADFEAVSSETRAGARQMAAVVQHIKTFAHHGDAHATRISLTNLLDGALKMSTVLIRQKARLMRDFGPVPDVEGLEFQLAQVFLNLLVNACQAIPDGVAANHKIGARLCTGPAGEAVVEIWDTGVGMSPEVLGKLFQPFFTTKPAGVGTGIGLTICRNIVESHGGRVEVSSTVGEGSLFRVSLPAMVKDVTTHLPEPTARLVNGPRGRVLVVDDDPSILASFKRCLEGEHAVTTELSGRAALAHFHAGARFDAIIADLMMPDVTGQQFLEALQRDFPDQYQKVIVITAGVLSDSSFEFLKTLTERLFEKPLDMRVLQERIRRMMRG